MGGWVAMLVEGR